MRVATRVKTRARAAAIRAAVDVLPTRRSHVFYSSWDGHFADSPRAIYEELVRQRLPFRHTWRVADGRQADLPAGVGVAAPGTVDHVRALGSARYVVTNT